MMVVNHMRDWVMGVQLQLVIIKILRSYQDCNGKIFFSNKMSLNKLIQFIENENGKKLGDAVLE